MCGRDLWPYRGIGVEDSMWPSRWATSPRASSRTSARGDDDQAGPARHRFVLGADNTCVICHAGHQTACVHGVPMGALGAQADLLRVPFADGTLIATPDVPSDELVPSLLSASDVLGTG